MYESSSHGMVMRILADYTDMLEQVSIDEAFLDVTGCLRLTGTGKEIAEKIKRRIFSELRLTASVGVAQTSFWRKSLPISKSRTDWSSLSRVRKKNFSRRFPYAVCGASAPKPAKFLKK